MSFFKSTKHVKKLLSPLIILAIVVPLFFVSFPQKTEAFPVVEVGHSGWANWITSVFSGSTAGGTTVNAANSTAFNIKEFVGKPLAIFAARQMLRGITAQTVNWINSGFQGNPAYVTDPNQFFLDIGDRTAARFLSSNGTLSKLCSPFKAQVRLQLIKNYISDDQTQYSCTLGQIENNFKAFTNDFTQGGWDAWFSVTQNNQNNPYGAYLDAKNTLSVEIANKQILKNKELDRGNGFLSFKKCVKREAPPKPPGPSVCDETDAANGLCTPTPGDAVDGAAVDEYGTPVEDAAQTAGDPPGAGKCIQTETVTPGSVIGAQLNKVVSSPATQLELVNDINQVVSALMTQMFTQVVGSIGNGLRGLSQPDKTTSNGAHSFLEAMAADTKERENASTTIDKGIPGNLQPNAKPLVTPPTDEEIKNGIKKNDAENTPAAAATDCTLFPTDPACTKTTNTTDTTTSGDTYTVGTRTGTTPTGRR